MSDERCHEGRVQLCTSAATTRARLGRRQVDFTPQEDKNIQLGVQR